MRISEKWWLRIIIGSFIACGAYATSGAAEPTETGKQVASTLSQSPSK